MQPRRGVLHRDRASHQSSGPSLAPQRGSGQSGSPPVPLAQAPPYSWGAHRAPCLGILAWGLLPGTSPMPGCLCTTCVCLRLGSSKITRRREARRKISESQLSSVCVLLVWPWKRVYFFSSMNSEFPERFHVFPEINTLTLTLTHTHF